MERHPGGSALTIWNGAPQPHMLRTIQEDSDMSQKTAANTEELPPHAQLVQMAMGHWISRIVYLAARLNLADRLAEGPKTADELAGPTETDAPSLYRLMRTLSNLGILSETSGRRFALTPLGEALRTGAPGSARPSV